MSTVDLHGVPIFSAGTWEGTGSKTGGDSFKEEDLDNIVKSFKQVGTQVKPRLILGHDKGKSEKFSGYPALGWITNLYREGKDLKADIKEMPAKIKELIDKKAYGRFSPGIWRKMKVAGNTHLNVLDHVALLGATLPANTDLDGMIEGLYAIENNDDLVQYNNKLEMNMDEIKFQEKLDALTSRITQLETENVAAIKAKDDVVIENTELKALFEKSEHDKNVVEFESFLDGQIKEGKVTPAQKADFVALAMGNDELKTFTYNDKIVEGNRIDLVKRVVENSSIVPIGEDSRKADMPEKPGNTEDEYDKKIIAYAKENKVSTSEAINNMEV